jgi:hypothetical protein
MMLRTIRVYGRLAKLLKRRKFEAAISSAAEAVRFLLANFPQLEQHMQDQHYKVLLGEVELEASDLHDPSGQQEIRIIPVLSGAGTVGRIIAGVALIAAAVFLGPAGAFIGGIGASVIGGTAATIAFGIGASLVLGGVAELLTPVPSLDPSGGQKDPKKTFSFSGIQQTKRAGVPVPIVYGETLVGSVVISAGIETVAT